MSRTARWVLVIALLQAVLVGAYWLVEHQRASKAEQRLGTEPPQRVSDPMPSLTVVYRDGSRAELSASGRPTLVHIWATWCPPCRTELPGLLALPSRNDVDVVAIALDQSWDEVDRFLGSLSSSQIVLAASEEVERTLGVRTLPATLFVTAAGRIALRFDGARDWTDEAFVRTYVEGGIDGR